jgi:hypothetical protein
VTEAVETVDAATAERDMMRKRHQQERTALLVSEYGAEHARAARYGMRTTNPVRQALDAKNRAALLRSEVDELRALPVNDAARRIETKRAEQAQLRRHEAERARQLEPYERDSSRPAPGADRPERRL